ncbi:MULTISPECIES: hypothetical protein [unclassified Burkholderia]|uniref:hypothetical protein n=1 Tax=unclassified Burkholderia TaxID=2613784 RepID=UPI000F590BCA|nr:MULTISPECIES: hypothetical protein [unclassified Burkholderia]
MSIMQRPPSGTFKSFQDELNSRICGDYGRWVLVKLYSGRWAPVWYACLDMEDYCELILEEDEFFRDEPCFDGDTANPSYPIAREALFAIIESLRNEVAENPLMAEAFDEDIRKATRDLKGCLESVTTTVGDCRPTISMRYSKNGEADYCLDVQVTGLASEQHAKAAAAHIQRLLFDDSTSDELKGK